MTSVVLETGPRQFNPDVMAGGPEFFGLIKEIDVVLSDGYSCYRFPSVERRTGSAIEGKGLFATQDIEPQTLMALKSGRVVNEAKIVELTRAGILHGSQQQIGEDAFLAGLTTDEEDRNLVGYNHSCNPNAFVMIPEKYPPLAFVVSRTTIKEDDEITVDYGASEHTNSHRFLCNCGADNCRIFVQPRYDWLKPGVQTAYPRHEFPGFLQRQIDKFNAMPIDIQSKVKAAVKVAEIAGRLVVISDELGSDLEEMRIARFGGKGLLTSIIKASALEQTPEKNDLRAVMLYSALAFAYLYPFSDQERKDMRIPRKVSRKMIRGVASNLKLLIETAKEADNRLGTINL